MGKIDVGTILWSMVGKKRNKEIHWYAKPECIEEVTEHMYLYGNGCGCSHNSVGRNCFLTREECIEDFLKSHDSLITESDHDEPLPENCYELPRTDWQDYEVCKFDGVAQTSVYMNGFSGLLNVDKHLKWRTHDCGGDMGMILKVLTLSEIYEQFAKDGHSPMLTVFVDDPMRCTIFQCGNYKHGKWVKLGEVMGYA